MSKLDEHPHQVIGHGGIESLASGRIRKLTNAKEVEFYEYINLRDLPAAQMWLKKFVPRLFPAEQGTSAGASTEVPIFLEDKDHGRSLDGAGLDPEMAWFFSDGKHLRKDVIKEVVQIMKRIGENMRTEKHFKFFSSSCFSSRAGRREND